MVLEFPGYPDGSVLSNLMLKMVPARDCVLNCEKRTNAIFKKVLTRPTVAPVNRRRKNALVPIAMSLDCNALANTWYGACRSRPRPIPAIKGKKILIELLDRSFNVIIKPGPHVKMLLRAFFFTDRRTKANGTDHQTRKRYPFLTAHIPPFDLPETHEPRSRHGDERGP